MCNMSGYFEHAGHLSLFRFLEVALRRKTPSLDLAGQQSADTVEKVSESAVVGPFGPPLQRPPAGFERAPCAASQAEIRVTAFSLIAT